MRILTYTVTPEEDGRMVKGILRGSLQLSYTLLKSLKWCENAILLNGQSVHVNTIVHAGDVVSVALSERTPREDLYCANAAKPDIVYEDDALLAVRKPAPLQVHPSPSAPRGADTLEGRVQSYLHSGAHPVHRLDAETTGIVLFAKLPYAQAHIQRQMQTDAFRKEYLAWVCGVPAAPEGVIDAPIARLGTGAKRAVRPDGRRAVTHYRVEQAAGGRALIRLRLETGRTHQIRVHLAHIGCPIIGDDKYGDRVGNRSFPAGLRLTATRIVFPNKLDGLEYLCGKSIEIEPPYNTQLIKNQL